MSLSLIAASEVTIELGVGNSTALQISDPNGGTLALVPVGSTGLQISGSVSTQIAIGNIKGGDGAPGLPGADGRDAEFSVSGTMLRYRLVGDVTWIDLVDLSAVVPGTLWGLIGGTLSDQADLQAALDAKLDDSQAGAFGLTMLAAADVAAARTSLNYTTALVPESSNLYFTEPRVRSTVLTGYAASGSRTALAASDSVLGAFGKLGKWVNDLVAIAFTGSAADLGGTKTATFISDFSSAADARITAQKAVASGLATLDAGGKIPTSQLPAIAITDRFVVASQAAMLALTAETGDIAIRTDLNKSFVLGGGGNPATLSDWQELLTPTDAVLSVNGQTGAVTLTTTNIGEGSNLYFTEPRVRSSVLTGFAAAGARTAIAAADSILTAFGKAQKYFNDLSALAFSGSATDLSGTKTSTFISDFNTAADARITAANKQGNIQFQDEGTDAGTSGGVSTLNFVGSGVSATFSSGTLTVAISGGGGGGLSDGDYGDITVSLGATQLTIDPKAVTYSKIQDVTAKRILGRADAADGVIEEITLGKNLAFSGTSIVESLTSVVIGKVLAVSDMGTQLTYAPTGWNDAEPDQATVLRWSGTDHMLLRSLTGGTAGRVAVIENASAEQLIVICHDQGSAGNKFYLGPKGPHLIVLPGESFTFVYDAVASYWRPVAPVPNYDGRLGWKRIAQVPGTGTAPISQGLAHTTASAGTLSTPAITTTNYRTSRRRTQAVTGTTAGTSSGTRHALQTVWRGNAAGLGGFLCHYQWAFNLLPASAASFFVGLYSSTAAPGNADVSTFLNIVGFGRDSADPTNVQFVFNDAAGVAGKINAGGTFPVDTTAVYDGTIFAVPNGSQITMVLWRSDDPTQLPYVLRLPASDIPASTALLSHYCYINNRAAAASYGIDWMLIEEFSP